MSGNYPKRTDLDFLTIVLLTLSMASVVMIVIRLVYTTTFYAPGPVIFASYLLSLILMVLCGALLFQKKWSLFFLSLTGKGYFLLSLLLLLMRAENLLDPAWFSTALASLYLATTNYMNPLRTYTGEERLTGFFIASRAASGSLLLGICITLYIVLISNLLPYSIRTIHYRDYSDLTIAADPGESPAHTWSEEWNVAVPLSLAPLDRDLGIGIWVNQEGERIIASSGVWSQRVEDYTFMGYREPYEVDKAVWKAGIGQPFLMMFKMIMADGATEAYFHESDLVKAVLLIKHAELGTFTMWTVVTHIYPLNDEPFTIESASKSRKNALLPVQMTLSRIQNDG